MSKITFRADDDLVSQLEDFDASKSEVMREALRAYLDRSSDGDDPDEASDGGDGAGTASRSPSDANASDAAGEDPVNAVLADRLDALAAERVDAVIAERVDAVLADQLDARAAERPAESTPSPGPQDVNVTITVDGEMATGPAVDATTAGEDSGATAGDDGATAGRSDDPTTDRDDRKTPTADGADADASAGTCSQCGESLTPGHVYCPNCGEKASHRVFCDCGDELRSDWAFCPSCGRRTPAADVLDRG